MHFEFVGTHVHTYNGFVEWKHLKQSASKCAETLHCLMKTNSLTIETCPVAAAQELLAHAGVQISSSLSLWGNIAFLIIFY